MQFSSFVFLSLFLPALFILSLIKPNYIRWQNVLLLGASLLFYAWGETRWIFLFILFWLVNWLLSFLLRGKAKHFFLVLIVGGDIAFLFLYKYINFAIQSLNQVFGKHWALLELAMPLGLSFFTFKAIAYAVDIYRGEREAERNGFNFLLYLSFFPQITAGPIQRYSAFSEQLEKRDCSWEKRAQGFRRFVLGLSKKLLLADCLAAYVDYAFSLTQSRWSAALYWLAALSYLLQIYYDFSGYSDMAIGLARLFGFETAENFLQPYLARSMKEFWRRWHISLSIWFRDYVYIPLGGNRKGKAKTYRNKLIVFALTGLWHGANWTFLVWGLFHGFFLLLEAFIQPKRWKKFFGHAYVILIVLISFVLFRSNSLAQAGGIIWSMLSGFAWNATAVSSFMRQITPSFLLSLGLSIVFIYPWQKRFKGMNWQLAGYIASAVLLLLCLMQLSSSSYHPFIYQQF